MAFNLEEYSKRAAAAGVDHTQPVMGGGGYKAPVEGPCVLTLVAYVEHGVHPGSFNPAESYAQCDYVFEVAGPNYPVKTTADGKKIPVRVTIKDEKCTMNDNSNNFRLVQKLIKAVPNAKNILDCLGKHYRGRIIHAKWKNDPSKFSVVLRNPATLGGDWTIDAPVKEDPETGETINIRKPEYFSEIRAFIWSMGDVEAFDNLFIEGEFKDKTTGKTKTANVFQEKIRSALNFKTSPIGLALAAREAGIDDQLADCFGDDAVEVAPEVATEAYSPDTVTNGYAMSEAKAPQAIIDELDQEDQIPF